MAKRQFFTVRLRPRVIAWLDLPGDLTVADVRRLEAFLRALGVAMDTDRAVEPGPGITQDGSTPERMRG
jgi:hypothetical protein